MINTNLCHWLINVCLHSACCLSICTSASKKRKKTANGCQVLKILFFPITRMYLHKPRYPHWWPKSIIIIISYYYLFVLFQESHKSYVHWLWIVRLQLCVQCCGVKPQNQAFVLSAVFIVHQLLCWKGKKSMGDSSTLNNCIDLMMVMSTIFPLTHDASWYVSLWYNKIAVIGAR